MLDHLADLVQAQKACDMSYADLAEESLAEQQQKYVGLGAWLPSMHIVFLLQRALGCYLAAHNATLPPLSADFTHSR